MTVPEPRRPGRTPPRSVEVPVEEQDRRSTDEVAGSSVTPRRAQIDPRRFDSPTRPATRPSEIPREADAVEVAPVLEAQGTVLDGQVRESVS